LWNLAAIRRKVLTVKANRFKLLLTAVLSICIGSLCSCFPVHSQSGAVGRYILGDGGQRIVLDVVADGSFTETITFRSGATQELTGKWSWSDGSISFDSLWIPKEFAPDYIGQTDSGSGVKYTEPGHWTISPEYHWGTVVLEVFEDVKFRSVKQTPFKFAFVLVSLSMVVYGALQCFSPRTLKLLQDRLRPKREHHVTATFFDRFAGFALLAVGLYVLLATLVP
jgi:hypothetical protein